MSDQWNWWRFALVGQRGPITESEPMSGYYRNRRKGEQASSVAYWYDTNDNSLRCQVNGKDVDEMRALESWPFASREPISYESYQQHRTTGKWPDMDEAVTPEGRNSTLGEEDESEEIKRQIDEAAESLAKYTKIENDTDKGAAQSLRSRLLELSGRADKIRKRDGDPHYEKYKAINGVWNPLVKLAKEYADKIRGSMDAYDNKKLEAVREAQEEVERRRRKAETEAQAAAEAGKEAPPPPVIPDAPVYTPQSVRGGYGRSASNKIVKVITEVTDWPALCAFLLVNSEFKEFAQKMAQRAVDKNFTVPGVVIQEKIKNV